MKNKDIGRRIGMFIALKGVEIIGGIIAIRFIHWIGMITLLKAIEIEPPHAILEYILAFWGGLLVCMFGVLILWGTGYLIRKWIKKNWEIAGEMSK